MLDMPGLDIRTQLKKTRCALPHELTKVVEHVSNGMTSSAANPCRRKAKVRGMVDHGCKSVDKSIVEADVRKLDVPEKHVSKALSS